MKKYPFAFVLMATGLLSLLIPSCTYTRLMGLSKKEIARLDTIYHQEFNNKFYITEWVFYEKQICQFKTQFVRTHVYTGTWAEKGDTLYANFFYKRKIAENWKFVVNRKTGQIVSIPDNP